MNATDLKNGETFLHYGHPYQVVKYNLIKLGRGSAYVKLTARNMETGGTEEISYQSNASVEEANTAKRKLQYLYKDGTTAYFMDPRSFEQVEIPLKVLGEQMLFVREGSEATVLFWDEKALSIDIPPKVVLTVSETDPGVKGNSASNIYKSAVLENGLKVKVPLFINAGEKIRVDSRTWDYIERAK
jgi:elongation factor P